MSAKPCHARHRDPAARPAQPAGIPAGPRRAQRAGAGRGLRAGGFRVMDQVKTGDKRAVQWHMSGHEAHHFCDSHCHTDAPSRGRSRRVGLHQAAFASLCGSSAVSGQSPNAARMRPKNGPIHWKNCRISSLPCAGRGNGSQEFRAYFRLSSLHEVRICTLSAPRCTIERPATSGLTRTHVSGILIQHCAKGGAGFGELSVLSRSEAAPPACFAQGARGV